MSGGRRRGSASFQWPRPSRVVHPLSPARRDCPPLVFAHRGGRALGPENTLAALDLGLAAGADGLEFDVRISRDGVPVLHHDPDLDRCTAACGPLEARTAAELARVDAAYWFDEANGYPLRNRGICVPALADALARYTGWPVIIEIKVGTADAARRVVEAVRDAGAVERVCIGSFSLLALQTVRALEPRIPTSAAREEGQWSLYRSWLGLPLGRTPYRGFQVPERAGRLTVVSPRFIQRGAPRRPPGAGVDSQRGTGHVAVARLGCRRTDQRSSRPGRAGQGCMGRRRAPSPVTHRRLFAALVLLGMALYVFPLVLDHPLIDPDEGLHAAIAQAMVEGGDYVTPRFLGEPFPDKPVFFFWALAGSLWAFGFTEAAARAPGLLFGLLGAVTTGLLAGTILGRRGGWLAGIFYATLSLPIGLMQMPVHDLALVPFTNGALLAFWRGARSARTLRVMAWSLLAGVCLGGAILTKGLSGVAIVGLAHATVLLIERRLRVAVVAGGVLALVIGMAVAAPWFIAMEHAHPGYLDYYLLQRHVLGFTTETQRHGKSAWHYYLPVVLGGGLPWILYAPFAIARQRPRASDPITECRFSDATRLGWSLLLTGTLFLSLSKSKLLTYALPLFPAIALLAAVAWLAWQQRAGAHPSRWFGRMPAVQAAVGALLLPAALVFAPAKFPVPHVELDVGGGRRDCSRMVGGRTRRVPAHRSGGGAGGHDDGRHARRGARRARSAGRQRDHRQGPGGDHQSLRPVSARVVDGRAAIRLARLLSRSRAAARPHPRSRPAAVLAPGARARAGSRHARGDHRRRLAPGSHGTCNSKGSRTCRPGTTACTMGSGCCTAMRR